MLTRGHTDQVRVAIERGLGLRVALPGPRAPTAPSLRSVHLFHAGSATSGAPWRSRNRAPSSRRLPSTLPCPARRAENWEGYAYHFLGNSKPRHSTPCVSAGLGLAVELGTSPLNFFGFDQRIRALVVSLPRILWLWGVSDQVLVFTQKGHQ